MEQLRVSYRREMNHNYMILSDPELQADSYVGKMLSENNIEGLLKFRQKHTEEGDVYCYEITSKQPLSRLLEGRLISYDEIRAILLSAAGMLRRTEEYLLKEEQILLEPDYIYVEPEDSRYFSACFRDTARAFRMLLHNCSNIFLRRLTIRITGVLSWPMGSTMRASKKIMGWKIF